ncbi:RHS repeat protein [Sideroxydans sp. CL21]|uniref:RHS repeat protein n=1 Tax=Sideroxydans sp. CL21 TaxID=2600596 RepID=UPI0024BC2996|nr:RHS repeat protein [Sideroxydans sp. CL21]
MNQGSAGYVADADAIGNLTQLTNTSGSVTGWTYTNENDEVETYNVLGELVSITNRAGLIQTLTYSDGTAGPNGGYVLSATGAPTTTILPAIHLIRVTDPAGRSLQYGYDGTGRVVKMTDPAGGVYLYAYSGTALTDNLTGVKYPDGKVRTYLYGEVGNVSATPAAGISYAHSLTGILDENGTRFASWTYDANGRATSSEHGSFGSGIDHVGLVYGAIDANGNSTTSVTDPNNITRTYGFSTLLNVVKNTGITGSPCDGCSASFTYDANGNVASRTDFNGNKTTYLYDLTRNLETSRTEASGTAVARTITTQWHPTLRLPTQISEPGRTTIFTYDATTRNLLTKTVTDSASSRSRTWTYTYTTAADTTLPNLLKSIKGPRTDVASITSFGYYPNGDLKTVTDALGHVTTINSVDGAGRPLTITDANGVITVLTYWPRGWLKTRTVGALTSNYTYDGVGQLTRVTLPDTSHLDYTWDAAHRLTDIADIKLDHIHYTLDNMGNRTKEDAYDATGKLSKTHSRVFDSLNHLAQDISAYNATTSYTTNYTYDANGNLTKVLDAKNNATLYGYDALNRLSQTTDAALGVTQYAYDALDQLNNVTDPKSLNTHYAVSALGEQTQLASPDSGTTNRSYDSAGNVLGATDARGIAATYTYDALNRPISVGFPVSSENINYVWDAAAGCSFGIGRLCQVTDADGTTTFAYDNQGNRVQKTRTESGVNFVTHYVYDAANRLVTVMTPTGETLSLTRDAAGYVQQVSDTNAGGTTTLAANIQYDGTGQATSALLGNGVTQNQQYTQSGQTSNTAAVRSLNPADIDASTVRLFLAGSYLKQSLLEPDLVGLFQPGTLSVFYDGTVNAGVGVASGQNHRAYFGIANTSAQNAAIPASLSGQKVLILDRSQGDSIYGVIPLAQASAIGAMSLDAACAPTGTTDSLGQWMWACPNTANLIPDAGLTDVEPGMFYGMNVPAGMGIPPAQMANLTATPVVGQAMGIILTDNFLTAGPGGTDALPSLSKAQVVGLMGGITNDWNWVNGTQPGGPIAGPVTVCRYQAGSGVQAAIGNFMAGSGCLISQQTLAIAQTTGSGNNNYTVIENDSPNTLARCMGYVQNGTPTGQTLNITSGQLGTAAADTTHIVLPVGGRAIGLMSLNRPSQNVTTEPYHFIQIATAAPTMENAIIGQYDLVVESVMERRNTTVAGVPPLAGSQLDLYTTLASTIGRPGMLGAAKVPSIPGVAALANPVTLNYDPTTTLFIGQSILLNPVLRVSRSGNTCRSLMQVQ